MASKSMNTLYIEQLAVLRQKRLDERAQLARSGRKTVLSLLLVLAVVALFLHFLFPVIIGHPVSDLGFKGLSGGQTALLQQAFAEHSFSTLEGGAAKLSLGSVRSWYLHRTQGIGDIMHAVPRMVASPQPE